MTPYNIEKIAVFCEGTELTSTTTILKGEERTIQKYDNDYLGTFRGKMLRTEFTCSAASNANETINVEYLEEDHDLYIKLYILGQPIVTTKQKRTGNFWDKAAAVMERINQGLNNFNQALNNNQAGNYNGNYNQNYNSSSYSGNNYYAGANNTQNTKIVHNYKNTFESDGTYTATTFTPNQYTSKEVYNDGKCILYTNETSDQKVEWRVCQCGLCDNDGTFLLGGTKISCIHCKGRKFVVYKEIQDFKKGTRTFVQNEGITDIYDLYTNEVIYSGTDKYVREQKELTDLIKSQTEQRREDSQFQHEMREQERHDNLCDTKLRNYLRFDRMLLDMKTGSSPYSESRKQSLQSDMRRYRQECPEITKSSLEDW